jgi:hypothetical protein
MRPTDVLVNADWVREQSSDGGVMLADVNEDAPGRGRSHLLCNCRHKQYAHRHYRPGSECALCICQNWSPQNPAR